MASECCAGARARGRVKMGWGQTLVSGWSDSSTKSDSVWLESEAGHTGGGEAMSTS